MYNHNLKIFAFPFVEESFCRMCLPMITFIVKHTNTYTKWFYIFEKKHSYFQINWHQSIDLKN